METLNHKDLQNLHQGIQKLYTLDDLDTFRVNVLSIVTQLIPSELPVFHSTHIRTRRISSSFLPNFPGFTPELERAVHKYTDEHPITQHMPQTLTGAYKVSDFVSEQELHSRKGIYQQFLRPLDTEDQMFLFLLNANPFSWIELLKSEANLVGIALHRPKRNFTERDRLILNLLCPHLFQAHNNVQKYYQLQQKIDRVQKSLDRLCSVTVDSQGRIKSIASQAAIWLQTYFEISTYADRLPDHLWSWVKYQTSCLDNNKCLSLAPVLLKMQYDNRELTIRLIIEPLEMMVDNRDRYTLLLEEQPLSSLNSLELLGLSQRETEVLRWVIKGKDNKTIGLQLSISTSTVRKHLESIYHKLNVQSRTGAISRALEKLGLIL
jgi:DNA-binding CsgD family transcriptional regulator